MGISMLTSLLLLMSEWSGPMSACADAAPLTEFWVASNVKTEPERTLLATLQGVVNKERFRLWIKAGGMYDRILKELSNGATIHELAGAWEALDAFKSDVAGMVLFEAKDDSINVATSLCGPLKAVAVEATLEQKANAAGLKVLADVRGWDQQRAWRAYRGFCHVGWRQPLLRRRELHRREGLLWQPASRYVQHDLGAGAAHG